ncbi:uncharacterized protein MONBRDRAFT_16205 [Monosiga brevicollis MX1]|uniref:Protein-tyrosine-phosphatase n=1 Tax=Monosiga brevicollis TaxID=81824 RepID=A9UW17_MONBE|nr:uncharacterized protein MONBRDRAFT_16205 [Monosiga brevicollis MX1]EDQ90483.1 predicted protein [Monosiga brevicollis MX1]|eukprot:XP_001744534.1 hypothetical protein [Monosiga brevicollis MX1]
MAPLPATLRSWWRMIWQEQVTAIVMATPLNENGTDLCSRYWAPSPVSGRPELSIGYLRTLLQIEAEDGEKRQLMHFWMYDWNPRNPDSLLYCLRDMHLSEKQLAKGGPILVHDSAGVGRAGVIIATDFATELLESTGKADTLGIVRELRQDRMALVQTPEHYLLVQQAIRLFARTAGVALSEIEDIHTQPEGAPAALTDTSARSGAIEHISMQATKKVNKKKKKKHRLSFRRRDGEDSSSDDSDNEGSGKKKGRNKNKGNALADKLRGLRQIHEGDDDLDNNVV